MTITYSYVLLGLLLVVAIVFCLDLWVVNAQWTKWSGYTVSPNRICWRYFKEEWTCKGVRDPLFEIPDWWVAVTTFTTFSLFALFFAILSGFCIICSCMKSKLPALLFVGFTAFAAICLMIALSIWSERGLEVSDHLTLADVEPKFAYGFALGWFLFVVLVLVVGVGLLFIIKNGDLVEYEPEKKVVRDKGKVRKRSKDVEHY